MQYIQTLIKPQDGGLHPVEIRLEEDAAVQRELLHNISLLDNDTAVTLFQFSGDPGRSREIAEESREILDYTLSAGDERFTMYVHFQPTETIIDLLSLFGEHELIRNMPLEYTQNGFLRASIVGQEAVVREVLLKIPDGIAMELEQLREYQPAQERLFSMLTPRKQETLRVAVEHGYYCVLREATIAELASVLDRSDATVGEHLRKIEAAVMAAITP